MVVLPHRVLQVIIDLDFFFLVFINNSIASMNPKDWKFLLIHLLQFNFLNHQNLSGMYKMRQRFMTLVFNQVQTYMQNNFY